MSHPFIYASEDAGAYGGVQSGSDVGGMFKTEALGYFCTTGDDECVPGEKTNEGQIGDCVFSSTKNHWSVGTKP